MFSKKATKIDEIFTVNLTFYVVSVKATVKILSIFVAFLENMNFKRFSINKKLIFRFKKEVLAQPCPALQFTWPNNSTYSGR